MDRHYPFEKMVLPYTLGELQPELDTTMLTLHYENVYALNLNELNLRLAPHFQYHTWTLEQLITDKLELPITTENNIKYLAGAVYNHELYFYMMGRDEKKANRQFTILYKKIVETYGSYEDFVKLFKQAAYSIYGVGYVWLVVEKDGRIHMVITRDYQTPNLKQVSPIFTLDTWEHAYYLQYTTELGIYIDNWFSVLDWTKADENLAIALRNQIHY